MIKMKRILVTCIGGYFTYQVVDSIKKVKKLSKFILGVDVNPNVNAFFADKFIVMFPLGTVLFRSVIRCYVSAESFRPHEMKG